MANNDPNYLLTQLASYLQTNGVGTIGSTLFMQYAPTQPHNLVCVYHTGGIHIPGNPLRHPTFTVQIRNTNASSALPLVRNVYNLLNDKWNVLSGLTGRMACQVEPGGYFQDSNSHFIYPVPVTLFTTDIR